MKKGMLSIGLMCIVTLIFSHGILVFDGEDGYCAQMTSSDVTVEVENQIAITVSQQEFVNNLNWPFVPKYIFPLPNGASATELRWCLEGEWYDAEIAPVPPDSLPPGPSEDWDSDLLEYMGETPLYFNMETTLEVNQTIIVEVTYIQLLEYAYGNVNYVYPNDYSLIQQDIIEHQSLTFDLTSERLITDIAMTSHTANSENNQGYHASIEYSASNLLPSVDFHLTYSLSSDDIGMWSMSTLYDPEDVPDEYGEGFFVFIVEPVTDTTDVISKHFTLIMDRSSSMMWDKWYQERDAAIYIMNNLNEGDYFRIVDFASDVNTFSNEMIPYNSTTREQAINYINNIVVTGHTNISGAFDEAVPAYYGSPGDVENVIIFLTDGVPFGDNTITDPDSLLAHVSGLIDDTGSEISIFNLSLGDDADFQFLTLLASQNGGIAIQANENDIEAEISELYNYIQNPIILDQILTTTPEYALSEIYPEPLPNLYIGHQMIITGRYNSVSAGIPIEVHLDGMASGVPVSFDYNTVLSDSVATRYRFLNKIWAKLKIEHLLVLYYSYDENSSEAEAIKDQIIELSVSYGVVSPFTSFVDNGVDVVDETISDDAPSAPYKLLGNHPNPFNPSTTIEFEVCKNITRLVKIKIYNVRGQLVKILTVHVDGIGKYSLTWNGTNIENKTVSSGLYYYVVDFGDALLMSKMTLLK